MKTIAIVGGGIIGLATALKAARLVHFDRIQLFEKENEIGQHQSSHNSGVLHCGLYYQPGSLKAKLAVDGIRQMVAFCIEHNIPYDICGKVVVAVEEHEIPRLEGLYQRGLANGLRDIKLLNAEESKRIEPHVAALAAIHVPEEGIVDYASVMRAMEKEITSKGHEIITGCKVNKIERDGGLQILLTNKGEFKVNQVINCAGLHCDRVAASSGVDLESRIIPFRGDYWKLNSEGEKLCRNLIYPVPDPTLPFLGVHFTRMIHGGVEAGPNAVLAFKREGYKKTDFSVRDTLDTVTWPGLYHFIKRYPGTTWKELKNSFSKKVFVKNLQRLVPEISLDHLSPEGACGVRAQAIRKDGAILLDFAIEKRQGQLHLINAPSPGATASLSIADYILSQLD